MFCNLPVANSIFPALTQRANDISSFSNFSTPSTTSRPHSLNYSFTFFNEELRANSYEFFEPQ